MYMYLDSQIHALICPNRGVLQIAGPGVNSVGGAVAGGLATRSFAAASDLLIGRYSACEH